MFNPRGPDFEIKKNELSHDVIEFYLVLTNENY